MTEQAALAALDRHLIYLHRRRRPDLPTERVCLRCGEPFRSVSASNRVCSSCQDRHAWRQIGKGKE